MKRKSLFGIIILAVASLIQSCDSDFNEVGSGIFGEDGFGFESYSVQTIKASTLGVGDVSTKNLPINNLGVYEDPVFGKSISHFVTQVEMGSASDFTSIKSNPVIDSVYFYVPYNSTVSNTDSDGNSTYTLNNVYGSGSFTLNVFENGYFLRDYDPNNNLDAQQYYSSDKPLFDANKIGLNGGRLNTSNAPGQNVNFKFSDSEIKLYSYDSIGQVVKDSNNNPVVKERKKPGIWLDLNKGYFQNRFFANGQYKTLINNNIFKEYFKGLYFNVQENGTESALAQLDFSAGELVIVYKQDRSDTDATRERKELKLKVGYSISSDQSARATTVNLIENQITNSYSDALLSSVSNPLWLKGNVGSVATISLFGDDLDANGVADELELLRDSEWLINQAVLTVFVDLSKQTNTVENQPNRLFLYDAKNSTVLLDHALDVSTNPDKSVHNGIIDVNEQKDVIKYRIRLTNHINNLIKKDSTNVVLGLAVTSDISNTSFAKLKTAKTSFDTKIQSVPMGSVTSPVGTVLYGPNAADSSLRMKLDIYYTKENN